MNYICDYLTPILACIIKFDQKALVQDMCEHQNKWPLHTIVYTDSKHCHHTVFSTWIKIKCLEMQEFCFIFLTMSKYTQGL